MHYYAGCIPWPTTLQGFRGDLSSNKLFKDTHTPHAKTQWDWNDDRVFTLPDPKVTCWT